MISRLIDHLTLIGIVMLAILIARAPNDRSVRPPTVIAKLDRAAPTDRVPENHFDHLSALASESANHHLAPIADPHTASSIRPPIDLPTYIVQAGDTPLSIALKFNLKPETILWGNPGLSNDASELQVGEKLDILPVDGVLHVVADGETLESIGQMHAASTNDIINFSGNHFDVGGPYRVEVGESIIVPNGSGGTEWQTPGPRVIAGQGRYSPGFYKGPLVSVGSSEFIWPTAYRRLSQSFWAGHPAIDVPIPIGSPIVAANSGTVIFAGWDNSGYGNLVIIDHGNGYWTYYAHNSELLVTNGDGVTQGQTIALSGNTGNSTGPHLDFRIRLNGGAFLDPLTLLP